MSIWRGTGNRNGVAEPDQARANKCSTAARAFFPKMPHPQGQRAALTRCQDLAALASDKNGAAFFGIAEGAVSVGLDSAMPRAEPSVAVFWRKMRAAVEHLFARA